MPGRDGATSYNYLLDGPLTVLTGSARAMQRKAVSIQSAMYYTEYLDEVPSIEGQARPSFRSSLSQPSQMGNFRHQSLRTTERERDRDTERERQRDERDREGQERLRNVRPASTNTALLIHNRPSFQTSTIVTVSRLVQTLLYEEKKGILRLI